EAEQLLAAASHATRLGRFQLEAAIQSAHARRAVTGCTPWASIALLYEGLTRLAPTIGALVAYAAALSEARGPEAALAMLATLDSDTIERYQPYWALKAHVLKGLGRWTAANAAYARAIELSEDLAVQDFLRAQASLLPRGGEDEARRYRSPRYVFLTR